MASRLQDVILIGIRAAQPVATTVPNGTLYAVTDEDNLIEQSDSLVWTQYGPTPAGGVAITSLTGEVTATGPGAAVATITPDAVTTAKILDANVTTPKIADANVTTVKILDANVTDAKISDRTATSVFGRSANSSGVGADIAAVSNDTVLQRVGSALVWAGITIGMIANNVITYAKLQQVAASRLLGNPTGAPADVSEISLVNGLEFSGTTLKTTTANRTRQVGITVDGGGLALTTGVKGYKSIPWSGTITGVRMLADQSGSCVVDIWKDTYANYPPVVGDSITAAAKPTISATTKSEDTTLTGWTTSVTAGDVLGFNVDSATTITRVTLELTIVITG